jgi:hypothetical protein
LIQLRHAWQHFLYRFDFFFGNFFFFFGSGCGIKLAIGGVFGSITFLLRRRVNTGTAVL